jgi:hypothetical protein
LNLMNSFPHFETLQKSGVRILGVVLLKSGGGLKCTWIMLSKNLGTVRILGA